ncbi:hypothetical protein [Streptomyces sp. G45]|uniref:hypothetical protein n=1 Tax=Streptomyces sp. G45 TaxID=3406627 RepID=UPI003C136C0F
MDGIVTLNGNGRQLLVSVAPYPGMAPGDEIQLRWDTGVLRTSRVDRQTIGAEEAGRAKLFSVEQPTPCTAQVSYLVGRTSEGWRASQRVTVSVRP